MATRKFNIDEVVAGAKIVQRSGEPAKFVSYTPEAEEETVVWLDSTGTLELAYATGGYYSLEGEDSEKDLFIWEPDPPSPKKIVQKYVGEAATVGAYYPSSVWADTKWDSLKQDKNSYPKIVFREVEGITPEFTKVPYVQ